MSIGQSIKSIFARAAGTSAREMIILNDRDREFRVDLDPSLPDDAYQQLFTLDLSHLPTGRLTWDRQRRSWCPTG